MADYECVICTKSEVFVYRIPARTSNRGYRAADWKLDEPDWTGRLRLITKGHQLTLKLDDAATGELFAQCPLESYPSAALEQVLDSSRYFVVRIQDGSGRSAFIGMGFADRGDSFDLLVAVQDHFKRVNRDISAESEQQQNVEGDSKSGSGSTGEPEPKLDLAFKEGQTIKINITTKKSGDGASGGTSRPRSKAAGGSGPFLPPPPSPSRHTGAGNGADSTATNIQTTTDRSQPLLDVASSSSSSSRHTEDPNWVSFE